jgi:hypothetical protein
MTYFPFDRKELDGLSDKSKQNAVQGCDIAEKICDYFQTWAKNYTETGEKGDVELKLNLKEKFLLASMTAILKLAPEKLSATQSVVCKLSLATQMDFYRENPSYIAVFGLDKAGKEEALQKLLDIHDRLGASYAPVDRYFEAAFSAFKDWAPTQWQPPSPDSKPAPKP